MHHFFFTHIGVHWLLDSTTVRLNNRVRVIQLRRTGFLIAIIHILFSMLLSQSTLYTQFLLIMPDYPYDYSGNTLKSMYYGTNLHVGLVTLLGELGVFALYSRLQTFPMSLYSAPLPSNSIYFLNKPTLTVLSKIFLFFFF